MNPQAVLEQLKQRFDQAIVAAGLEALDPWIQVAPASLAEIARWLHDEPSLVFDYLHCITAVDYLQTDPKRKIEGEPRIEVLYHLSSMTHRHRLVLKVVLPRWKDGVAGQLPELPSVADVWRTAEWHEREVYDLSGVHFMGHPDLRRILCPEDWVGHPLRKDYQMPTEYHGIRSR
jgi:NADH-quinone oxidoreductase subunit C